MATTQRRKRTRKPAVKPPHNPTIKESTDSVEAGAQLVADALEAFRIKRHDENDGHYLRAITRKRDNAVADLSYHDDRAFEQLAVNNANAARAHLKAKDRAQESLDTFEVSKAIYTRSAVPGSANRVKAVYNALPMAIPDAKRMRLAFEYGNASGSIRTRVNRALASIG